MVKGTHSLKMPEVVQRGSLTESAGGGLKGLIHEIAMWRFIGTHSPSGG